VLAFARDRVFYTKNMPFTKINKNAKIILKGRSFKIFKLSL